MNNVYSFKKLFEAIPDFKKTVFVMFLFKHDVVILHEGGF